MRTKWFVLLVAAFTALTLWGCGSNGGSGGSDVADPDDPGTVETVGIVNCTRCHDIISNETNSWLFSNHGNPDSSPGSSGPADETSSCQPCHNQLLDGQEMEKAFPPDYKIGERTDRNTGAVIPIYADTPRNVASCESCHGGGSAHRGVGPIPFPRPDWEQCVSCHDIADDGTRTQHAENWGMLASSVGASTHNNSDDLHASTTRCQRCHTAEGSTELSQYTGDADVMHLMDDLEPIAVEEDLHALTCAACHIPHEDSGRWESFIVNDNELATGDWDPNANGVADQFDFCTSCHTYYNQDGVMAGSGSDASGTAPFYHNTAWYRTLPTTHYDNPATNEAAAENLVEGYVIRELGDSPCFDCHGHELRTNTRHSQDEPEADDNPADYGSTIHTQWASSGHGGRLLKQKYAADSGSRSEENVDNVMAAGVDSDSGDAWIHYNWDDTDSRGDCQECHTATGASNYLDDPSTYDSANNDYSHLEGWAATGGSPQNELLYCWGCHDNPATGVLLNPGAVARPYTVDGVQVVLPDVGNSNTCINCHGARGNVEGYGLPQPLDPLADMSALKPGFGPGTKNVTEAHYLVAAATIYALDTVIGYEYAGLDYAPVPYFAHDGIALNGDDPETGNGPCAACHMETAEPHLFEVVTKDDAGVITALNSTACIECHTGEHGAALEVGSAEAAAFLEEEAEGYHEALEIMLNGLAAVGIDWTGGYPYFSATTWVNEGNFGAAHNYNYLHHEPGAYAHNRFYAKRLIFDSIDWLDNYTMDGTITVDVVTYPEAAHWFSADETTGVASRP